MSSRYVRHCRRLHPTAPGQQQGGHRRLPAAERGCRSRAARAPLTAPVQLFSNNPQGGPSSRRRRCSQPGAGGCSPAGSALPRPPALYPPCRPLLARPGPAAPSPRRGPPAALPCCARRRRRRRSPGRRGEEPALASAPRRECGSATGRGCGPPSGGEVPPPSPTWVRLRQQSRLLPGAGDPRPSDCGRAKPNAR